SRDGWRIYFATSDQGNGKIGWVAADGAGPGGAKPEILASDLGGDDLGRPYSGGTYTVATGTSAPNDVPLAYSWTRPERPPEVAVVGEGRKTAVLTRLNDDLFTGKHLSSVEEIWPEPSYDHRRIQSWILKP